MWTGGLAPRSFDLNPSYFFALDCMKSTVYQTGKPEARHQLVEATDKAAIRIRNELGRMKWQNQCNNYVQHACSQIVDISNMCYIRNNFESYLLKTFKVS
jgi:hypothetical protein